MNSELINKYNKLVDLYEKWCEEVEKLVANQDKLKNKSKISDKTQDKIDTIEALLRTARDKRNKLYDELQEIDKIEKEIEQVKQDLNNTRGTADEAHFKDIYDENCDLYIQHINDTYAKYEDMMKTDTGKFKITKKKVIVTGAVAVSAIAIVAAIKLGPTVWEKISNKQNENPDGSNPPSSQGSDENPNENNSANPNNEQTEAPAVTSIPELDNSTLSQVENEEQVAKRAEELLGFLDAVTPGHEYTLEDLITYLNYKNDFETQTVSQTPTSGTLTDINDEDHIYERVNGVIVPAYEGLAPEYGVDEAYAVDMFNYINGGVVEEVSREDALDVIKMAEVLMNNEYLYACDIRNKGESLREENTDTIDYGIFFLDGTRAQRLASKISDCRRRIITAPTSEDADLAAKEFTELLMNSWYLQGNGEISAYALETSGGSAFVDKLFLNTADLAQANMSENHNITVTNPLTGEEVTLVFLIEEINKANCPGELVADNGDIIPTYINKFSADMEGMVKEAAYNKQAAAENFTYGLNYNN